MQPYCTQATCHLLGDKLSLQCHTLIAYCILRLSYRNLSQQVLITTESDSNGFIMSGLYSNCSCVDQYLIHMQYPCQQAICNYLSKRFLHWKTCTMNTLGTIQSFIKSHMTKWMPSNKFFVHLQVGIPWQLLAALLLWTGENIVTGGVKQGSVRNFRSLNVT